MRKVIWTDEDGWKRCSLIRDDDHDDMAESGVPLNPPDLNKIDWDLVAKDINNTFVDRGLFSIKDINKPNNGFTNAILAAIKVKIINLYKQEEVY